MKAILQSEFACIRTFAPATIALLLLVCIFLSWSTTSTEVTCSVCAMMPMLLTLSCATIDESNGWGRYRAALPYSRRDIIAGRYLAVLLTTAATTVATIAIGTALDALIGPFIADFKHTTLPDAVISCTLATVIGLVVCAIVQPFFVKFGSSKGIRYVMIVCFLGTFAIVGFVQGQLDERTLMLVGQWLDANLPTALAATAVAALVLLALSYAISLRIYQRKDL